MSKKQVLINQPAGLGDILFCQKIAKKLVESGSDVFWPIAPQLSYINDYLDSPGITYSAGQTDNTLNLQDADRIFGGCVIRAKYSLAGESSEDWQDYLSFNRNKDKEEELFNLLGCEKQEYAFVNRKYGTLPNYAVKNFKFHTDLPIIESEIIERFTPFDWCKVWENAKEIYTVDTSIMVIMEKLNLKSESNNVWGRLDHFTHVEGLFRQKWNYRK